MLSYSGLQTLFAIDGSIALGVGPVTAVCPPVVHGLCCFSVSAASHS